MTGKPRDSVFDVGGIVEGTMTSVSGDGQGTNDRLQRVHVKLRGEDKGWVARVLVGRGGPEEGV